MKFKVGDTVQVVAGKDKGKTGEITKIYPVAQKVTVKGMNVSKRHLKAREGVEGGIYPVEKPLPVANIALLDPVAKKITRIGYKLLANGVKVRIAKKSGTELDKPEKTTTQKTQSKKTNNKKK